MYKKETYVKAGFFIVFFTLILTIGITTICNHRSKSTLEGRELTMFPDVSLFTADVDSAISQTNEAFSDQNAFRNSIIQLYNRFTLQVLNQSFSKEVVVGSHDEMYSSPSFITDTQAYQENLDHCADMINSQAQPILDMGIPFIFISYPQKDVVMWQDLPSYYPNTKKVYEESMTYLKSKLMDGIIVIDGATLFNDGVRNKFYYTQDHHTNIRGQQLVYDTVMDYIQQDYPEIKRYTLDDYTIEDSVVQGAFNRKIGNIMHTDSEALYVYPKTFDYTFTRYEDGEVSNLALMKKTGSYTSYMSGDFGETRIVKSDDESDLKVLISGSSFTNALEYLMIPSVHELLSIDYRHNMSGLQLKEYVEKEQPDYVIFIPSQSTGSFLDYMYKQHLGLSEKSSNE